MSPSTYSANTKRSIVVNAIVQARLNATRLPNKVLMDLGGKPVLQHVIDRLKMCKTLSHIVVASPDKELVEFAYQHGVWGYQDSGDQNNVLSRYIKAGAWSGAQVVVRITGDCPFIEPSVVDECVEKYINSRVDIVSNVFRRTYPKGQDVEVMHLNTLKRIYHLTDDPLYREHVTLYIYENPALFKVLNVSNEGKDYSFINLSIDTKYDIDKMNKLVSTFSGEMYLDDVIMKYEEMY